jgi:6-pyruvoyltetrahydropterin/6-carboxytetrahydropterin synthase
VFNADDPMKDRLLAVGGAALWKPYVVPSCSCEGMARHLFEVFGGLVREATSGRVAVVAVEVEEDSKNSAAYTASDAAPPRA